VTPVTGEISVAPYIWINGDGSSPHTNETEPTMSRQTRINVAALLLATPMVIVGLSVTPGF